MQIRSIDPRDTQWEVDAEAYRVHFWDRPTDPEQMLTCEETRVSGVDDVSQVLEWATSYAGDRDVVVYLEVTSSLRSSTRRPGLVRLLGQDPNATT